jgi:hypothetical protein
MNDRERDKSLSSDDCRGTDGQRRPKRLRITAEESLRRMKEFEKRRDAFIAAIRKGKD